MMKSLPHGLVVTVLLLVTSYAQSNSLVRIGNIADENGDLTVGKDPHESTEKFVATHEWQEIKPGESIPKGLHVRINFQTGLKEAKLLDSEPEQQAQLLGEGEHIGVPLEEALKNIASSHDEPSGNNEPGPIGTKQKFRSLEEIKSSLAKQNVSISSEMELITELHKKLLSGSEDGNVLLALEDLEFYVHKYDNAVHFTDLGGVALLKHFIETSPDVRIVAKASLALGSAAQSNVYVAKAACHYGIVPIMLSRLRNAADDKTLSNRLLYAISALARTDDDVVVDLAAHGAAGVFRLIIEDERFELKSKVKVYTLIDDLVSYSKGESSGVDSLLKEHSLAETMCSHLSTLLNQASQIDQVDKLLSFLNRSLSNSLCKNYSTQLTSILSKMEVKYSEQLDDPDVGDFYGTLVQHITFAKSNIASKNRTDHISEEL